MQCYRLRTFPCQSGAMKANPISILSPIRRRRPFLRFHSPDSAFSTFSDYMPDSLIFFLTRKRNRLVARDEVSTLNV